MALLVALLVAWSGDAWSAARDADHPGGTAPPATPIKSFGWLDAHGRPAPFQSDDELLEYLRAADVVSMQQISTGINRPSKVLLERDGLQMHAVFRDVKIEKRSGPQRRKKAYLDFRDKAIYEVAAYRLGRVLGLHRVPPAVVRTLRGRPGSLQVWMEGTAMALEHHRGRISPPEPMRWFYQLQVMEIFDNLAGNADRNYGNILIDRQWSMWLIDHTRAFVKSTVPLDTRRIKYCERRLWESLVEVEDEVIRQALEPSLSPFEIDCVLSRRAKLVDLIQALIAERGADDVLYEMPPAAAEPAVWPWEQGGQDDEARDRAVPG